MGVTATRWPRWVCAGGGLSGLGLWEAPGAAARGGHARRDPRRRSVGWAGVVPRVPTPSVPPRLSHPQISFAGLPFLEVTWGL